MHASPSIVVNEQNVIYLSSTEDMAVEWPYGMATKKFSTRHEEKRSIYLIFGPRG